MRDIYDGVLTCQSAIPKTEIELLADVVRNNGRMGIPWRLTAFLAGQDGAFYREVAENEEKAKALAPNIGALQDFAAMLKKVSELANCVSMRLMVAGCNHENFNTWKNDPA